MPNLDSLKKIINLQQLTVLSVVVLVMVVINNLVNTNLLATQGAVVSEVEIKTLVLEKENQNLSVQISQATRLSDLESSALSLGFQRTKEMVFAPHTNTFALR